MVYQVNTDIDKLQQAVGEYSNWQGHACVMYDVSDGTSWTNVFAADDEWIEYESPTIVCLACKGSAMGRNRGMSLKRATAMAREYHKYDWDALQGYDRYVTTARIESEYGQ
mgnify:CR=1 FL=1